MISFKKWLESCPNTGSGNAMGISGSIVVKTDPLDSQKYPALNSIRHPNIDQIPVSKKRKIIKNQIQN